MSADLAARQAALVEALVAGGPDPIGFDPERLAATRRALLRKRAGQAAAAWPLLAAALGPNWTPTFAARFDGVAPTDALREGWDLARELRSDARFTPGAARELAAREAALHYDGVSAPRRRSRADAALRHLLKRS
ncbi:MAG: hypothetical protein ABW212_00375 [Pseudonocardia sediminis]